MYINLIIRLLKPLLYNTLIQNLITSYTMSSQSDLSSMNKITNVNQSDLLLNINKQVFYNLSLNII